ncbi:ice-binding family protein [Streptosporangium sp. NBC_01495]|uniref:ice-binding family protein n=1 Tax=Streptosporangium sp. NBC_01495 TaxID=2903899 RepID=UPI002E32D053|nr:ice-binding family protein [Streptosporangium sp. NBC_01495]
MMEAVRPRVVPRNAVRSRLAGVLTAVVALGAVAVTPATASAVTVSPVAVTPATASATAVTPPTVTPATAGATAVTPATADAATPVQLGTAANFEVLGRDAVTNTGPTVVTGDLGLWPGTALSGFPPGTVTGTVHQTDAAAQQAQTDLTVAYDDAAGRPVDATVPTELGGITVTPGVYDSAAGTFQITGTLTLDARGDPGAVFIFKTASTLVTASDGTVTLVNGAQAANVFWQVGSSATLGTNSAFSGNILALSAITATTGVTVVGRLLSRGGAITLNTNTVAPPFAQLCGTATTTTTLTSTCPLGDGGPITFTATVTSSDATVPTGQVTFATDGAALGTAQLGAGGVATLTVSDLPAGVNRVVATYAGTAQLDPSTSPVLIQRVDLGCPCLGPLPERSGERDSARRDDHAGPGAERKSHTRITAAATGCGRRS